jgi:hypothetical protein
LGQQRLFLQQEKKGGGTMRVRKMLTAVGFGLLAMVLMGTGPAARAQEGPAYLRALSDLRTARDYIQFDHRPEFGGERHHAVEEINKAISEIKHAAWDDGKNTQFAPPSQGVADGFAPMHEAIRWLDAARNHVMSGPDQPANQGLRERAMIHIDEAHHAIEMIVRTVQQQ